MQTSGHEKLSPHATAKQPGSGRSIFIYLCSHRFWLGLFETADLSYIRNLFIHQIVQDTDVLMTIFVPEGVAGQKIDKLSKKEEALREFLKGYGADVTFLHLRGRKITDILNTPARIHQLTQNYRNRLIWAKNYFNCFIGVLIKKRHRDIRLHFDMSGLVPEEVLYYSRYFLLLRLLFFLILKIVERVNCKKADSVSVVSRRFKEYIVSRHHLAEQKVSVIPVLFDYGKFFLNWELRKQYRERFIITEEQKLILYSGTLIKWQETDRLFAFFRRIQDQDINREYRFMILTFDQAKARHYKEKYGIDKLILETASSEELNGFYNAADIGIAIRSADKVSFFSSPVKIPEYLATGNSLITLDYIGDFGSDLKGKDFALLKPNLEVLLITGIDEIRRLKKPTAAELEDILSNFSIKKNIDVIRRIVNYR